MAIASKPETAEQLLQIGEVARRVGLSLRTVRYYEEAGLVRPSGRTEGGFRLYGGDEVARLFLVKRMKPLGFSIDEMRNLLAARDQLLDDDAPEAGQARAYESLSGFAVEARQKCDQLRLQLENAEGFAAELQADLRRRRRSVRSEQD